MEEGIKIAQNNTPPIQVKKERNSSTELFRILATFLVLITHYNGWFVGGVPDSFDFSNISLFRCSQMIITSLTAACVNCFLVISGYFGINLKIKTIYSFLTLLLGIYVPMYVLNCFLFGDFTILSFLKSFLVISGGGYFVQCYFMLMLLSPILNSFIEQKGHGALYLISILVLLEFYFDCVQCIENFGFNNGYSLPHFCLMYLIARMMRLYQDRLTLKPMYFWTAGYFLISLLLSLLYISGVKFAFCYSNPLVIFQSIFLFVPFLYHNRHNKYVNWIAQSTFCVYILQVTMPFGKIIRFADNYLLNNLNYLQYFFVSIFVIIVFFIGCIIYDKIRRFCFDRFFNGLYNTLTSLWIRT